MMSRQIEEFNQEFFFLFSTFNNRQQSIIEYE